MTTETPVPETEFSKAMNQRKQQTRLTTILAVVTVVAYLAAVIGDVTYASVAAQILLVSTIFSAARWAYAAGKVHGHRVGYNDGWAMGQITERARVANRAYAARQEPR